MRRIWIAVVLVGAMLTVGAARVGARQAHEPTVRRHVVQPGETLWGIARAAYPGVDPREAVDRIRRVSHIGRTDIVPGQTVLLPAG